MKENRKRGVTLVELMVATALLGIVLALGYQTLSYLMGTYSRTEEKWLLERDVNAVMSQLSDSFRLAYGVQLNSEVPTDADEDHIVIYQGTDAKSEPCVFVLEQGASPSEAVKLGEFPTQIRFSQAEKKDEDGNATGTYYTNAIQLTVSAASENSSYALSQTVFFPNLQQSVQGDAGTALAYVPNGEDGFHYDSSGTNAGCFIATAAYGDYDQSGVMLLRRFRDQVLLTNAPGQWFVERYYALSPPIAEVIALHPALRLLTRVLLLPLQGVAVALLHPAFAGTISCLYFGSWYGLRRKKARAQTQPKQR